MNVGQSFNFQASLMGAWLAGGIENRDETDIWKGSTRLYGAGGPWGGAVGPRL